MKKKLAAVFAALFCLGATVALADEASDDLQPMGGEAAASPAAAREMDRHVQALRDQAAAEASEARAQVQTNPAMAKVVAALDIRVARLEAISQQLRAAARGETRVSVRKVVVKVEQSVIRNLKVDTAAALAGGVQTRAVAAEALERAKLAQAEIKALKAKVAELQQRGARQEPGYEQSASAGSPNSVVPVLSVFGGWNGSAIGGIGIGLDSHGHTLDIKFDGRLAGGADGKRELDAMLALKMDFPSWYPYAGLHWSGIFDNGFTGGLDENRVGGNAGAVIGLGRGWALDLRANADQGGRSAVLGATGGLEFRF